MQKNTYCTVKIKNFRAYCTNMIALEHTTRFMMDGAMIEEPVGDFAYFISLCGNSTSVKGVCSNFIEGKELYFNNSLGEVAEFLKPDIQLNTLLQKLPSGFIHAIILPALALPQTMVNVDSNLFYLFLNKKDKHYTRNTFFRHLDEKTDIPLHFLWSDWLWDKFIEHEWLTELTTITGNYQGFKVQWNDMILQESLSREIKEKKLEIFDLNKIGSN